MLAASREYPLRNANGRKVSRVYKMGYKVEKKRHQDMTGPWWGQWTEDGHNRKKIYFSGKAVWDNCKTSLSWVCACNWPCMLHVAILSGLILLVNYTVWSLDSHIQSHGVGFASLAAISRLLRVNDNDECREPCDQKGTTCTKAKSLCHES